MSEQPKDPESGQPPYSSATPAQLPKAESTRLPIHQWTDNITLALRGVLITRSNPNVKSLPVRYIIDQSQKALKIVGWFEVHKHDTIVNACTKRLLEAEEKFAQLEQKYQATSPWKVFELKRIFRQCQKLQAKIDGMKEVIEVMKTTRPTFQ